MKQLKMKRLLGMFLGPLAASMLGNALTEREI